MRGMLLLFLLAFGTLSVAAADEGGYAPDEWVDEATGHRVIRLSRREGGNATFYFHQNPFTAKGDKMLFSGGTPEGGRLFAVDLKTLEVEQVTDRPSKFDVVARKRHEVFYLSGQTVHATHLDSHNTRRIVTIPEEWTCGTGFTINADETLLAGAYMEGQAEYLERTPGESGDEIRYPLDRNEWCGHFNVSRDGADAPGGPKAYPRTLESRRFLRLSVFGAIRGLMPPARLT
ncbi:MAG TPA: hypothetical protein HPP77_05015 [Candidatus Hydrogenedentes bacterium]|nr:hypothetical protein [Candidatus Hydrogenedentota bacterium]HIJ74440.1 hypothetical protein [Candidatus Hydrogenedentota bacterium]